MADIPDTLQEKLRAILYPYANNDVARLHIDIKTVPAIVQAFKDAGYVDIHDYLRFLEEQSKPTERILKYMEHVKKHRTGISENQEDV